MFKVNCMLSGCFTSQSYPNRVTPETLEGTEFQDQLERRAQLETLVPLAPLDPVDPPVAEGRGECKDPLEMMDAKELMEHVEALV